MFSKYFCRYSSSVGKHCVPAKGVYAHLSFFHLSKETESSLLAESFFFFSINSSCGVHRQIWPLGEVFSSYSQETYLPSSSGLYPAHIYCFKRNKVSGSCTQVDKKSPLLIGIWCGGWSIRRISKYFLSSQTIFPFLLLNIWFKREIGCLDPVFHKTILPILSLSRKLQVGKSIHSKSLVWLWNYILSYKPQHLKTCLRLMGLRFLS